MAYLKLLTLAALFISSATNAHAQHLNLNGSSVGFDVEPFIINLSDEFSRLKTLASNTLLPDKPEFLGALRPFDIELDFLKSLQNEWVEDYNWDQEQAKLNEYKQYTVTIEGIRIHFIHENSVDEQAIPLILLHGWPGSFTEFIPVINPLTELAKTSSGRNVSYHVIVPSLPGFTFSSAPPANWTVHDTARIFNTLMVDVLGYSTYAVHGTDWGSWIGYSLYDSYNRTARAAHFDFLPFSSPTPQQIAAANVTLTPLEKLATQRSVVFLETAAYFSGQTNKPNQLGFALYDSPVGQLSWIAAFFRADSNGTYPSVLTNTTILTSVSLYYLTQSFVSSIYIYAQNPGGFLSSYTKANTDAPLLFSTFINNVGFWPRQYVEKIGNLVYYKEHAVGGHFAGLDNPPALIEDIREIGDHF